MKSIILKDYLLLSYEEHTNLLKIRNQKEIRYASLSNTTIHIKEHLSWIEKLKNDKTKQYFAIIYNDKIIGGVNIFDKDKDLKWGIFFSDKTPLIIKSIIPIYYIDSIFNENDITYIFSEIKKENVNAISYNKNLGFVDVNSNSSEVVTMKLSFDNYTKIKENTMLKRIIKKMYLYDIKLER